MDTDKLFMDDYIIPQPLSKEESYHLIKEAKEGSKEAKDRLITHNIRLVLYTVSNHFQTVNYDKKDLFQIGVIGLMKAVDTYDVSKNIKFNTYAIRCIDNEIRMFLRKLKKYSKMDSIKSTIFVNEYSDEEKLEDVLRDNGDFVEDVEKEETNRIIREIVQELPSRDKEIIMLHFGFYDNKIYKQREIASMFQVNQPYISRLITRVVKQLGNILASKEIIELHSKKKVKKKLK